VARVRQQYATGGGLEAAVDRKAPDREYRRKLDGQQEAHLVALACSAPPEGRKRCTLRLLAQQAGTFVVNSRDVGTLHRLGAVLHEAFHDRALLTALIGDADPNLLW
jgi:hypothetical protein